MMAPGRNRHLKRVSFVYRELAKQSSRLSHSAPGKRLSNGPELAAPWEPSRLAKFSAVMQNREAAAGEPS